MHSSKISSIVFITCLFLAGSAIAQQTGYAIMSQSLNRSTIETMTADLKLILRTSTGDTRQREIKFHSKTDPETDQTKMLMRFVYPQDVRGTGFLSLEYTDRPDDRFLYMPALRQIKKIASSGSGGNFMSSDFTYYDIGTPELKDWKYQHLREETFAGREAYVIECLPGSAQISEDTGYSRVIRWVAKDDLTIFHSEYYDASGELKKRLDVEKFEMINGSPFATEMVMHDVIIDHTSRMIFENLEVNKPIRDSFFTPRMLQRGQ